MSNNSESLNYCNDDLKRTANGVIDIDFYRHEAEVLRSRFIRECTASLFAGIRKRLSAAVSGNAPHPAANIVGYQKLTLEV